jgi:3-oxoacyl-[acyl-carrier-protein] synthase-3
VTIAAVLAGLGAFLPDRLVTNGELAEVLDTSDEWIRTRTGIDQRYWISETQATSDLAVGAGRRALASAGWPDIDLVVLATTTPDFLCPATAPEVAARLGLGTVAAYDLSAVCAGFVYALASAAGSIVAGIARTALVIGAESYSTILDPADRSTSVIFGDGAGAVVLRAGDSTEPGAFLAFDLGSDGANRSLITIPSGGSRRGSPDSAAQPSGRAYFQMSGREVFKHAVNRMAGSCAAVLDCVGWSKSSVDRIVAHQANVRILHAVTDVLDMENSRHVINVDQVGNTSSASVPLALEYGALSDQLRCGQRVLLTAFGGGLAWGSTVLVWPDLKLSDEVTNQRRT